MDTWEITTIMVDIMVTVIQLAMDALVLMLQTVSTAVIMRTPMTDTVDAWMVTTAIIAHCHRVQEFRATTTETVICLVAQPVTVLSLMTAMPVERTLILTTGASVHVIRDTLEFTVPLITLTQHIMPVHATIHAQEAATAQRLMTALAAVTTPTWICTATVLAMMDGMEISATSSSMVEHYMEDMEMLCTAVHLQHITHMETMQARIIIMTTDTDHHCIPPTTPTLPQSTTP